jgi:Family of unknown function (DUF6502)
MSTENPIAASPEAQALQDALRSLLGPLGRLAVARGLPYAGVEELLKQAFVKAASDAHPGLPAHRKVSRISTVTGINRREVTRLTQQDASAPPRGRSLVTELFTHWLTSRRYRQRGGEPRDLPRQGPAPSFESLAQQITRDVHPRSLLDELLRLKLAVLDEATDTVSLVRDAFVPRGDAVRMLGFLGDNVGDHLHASVDNVLGNGLSHFEQAIFADGLSDDSMARVRDLIRTHWQLLLDGLVPALEAMVASDGALQPPPERRLRVGLYTFEDPGAAGTLAAEPLPVARRKTAAPGKKGQP